MTNGGRDDKLELSLRAPTRNPCCVCYWSPSSRRLETRRQRAAMAGQQIAIEPNRNEHATERNVAPRQRVVGHQDAGGFAGTQDTHKGVLDRGAHPRVVLLADMAHGGRQVSRPDEDTVNAFNRRNGIEVVERGLRLGLYQHANLLVGLMAVIRHTAPARSARASHAADALRRVACGLHDGARLLGRVDHRHQNRLHTEIEVLLDQRRADMTMADRHAGNRVRSRVAGNRLQLRQDGVEIVGRVLAVISNQSKPAPAQISVV